MNIAVDQGRLIPLKKRNLRITREAEIEEHEIFRLPGFVDLHMHLTMTYEENDEIEHQTLIEMVEKYSVNMSNLK